VLVLLTPGVRTNDALASWAHRMLPNAVAAVDLGGDKPETAEEKAARVAQSMRVRRELKEKQDAARQRQEQAEAQSKKRHRTHNIAHHIASGLPQNPLDYRTTGLD
jgi:hypothetical protein